MPAPVATDAPARAPLPGGKTAGLQERLTFDTFVPGPANEFAHAVARRVASWADGHFNPVVFHGPYGFGKTHLLNALAWEAMRAQPGKRVVYLSAERFTSTFVKALQDKQTQAFKEELRNADLLLIDRSDGLPPQGSALLAARPADTVPSQDGDVSRVLRRLTLKP